MSAALTGPRNAWVASRRTVSVAQPRSSSAVVGRQPNTLRRLGVSEMPVTFIGPAMTRSWMCGAEVMPKPVPMRMSTRVWSIGIIRSSTGPTKRGTNAAATRCGPALTWIERGVDLEAALEGVAHARLHLEHRGALAVDRDLQQLVAPGHGDAGVAEQLAADRALEQAGELVVAVGGEVVDHGDAAARAERRALDVAHLRFDLQHAVGGRGRRRLLVADGQAAHLRGRPQVAVEQGRAEALRLGDVVEAVGLGVGAAGTA